MKLDIASRCPLIFREIGIDKIGWFWYRYLQRVGKYSVTGKPIQMEKQA